MESVDYTDTFIAAAPDSGATAGQQPPAATVAGRTYGLIVERPYGYRSSEVIYRVWLDRQSEGDPARTTSWADFYARPRACLRSSDLGKRWGWGIHADGDGRLMIYGVETPEYALLASGTAPGGQPVRVVRALRQKR